MHTVNQQNVGSGQWRRLHGAPGARAPTFTNVWARGAP